jgi:hypothetical protein
MKKEEKKEEIKPNEDKLQQICYTWANNNYCLLHHKPQCQIFSVPNGGTRNKIEAMKLVATGLKAGVSDLIALFPNGLCVFFELKINTGKQSDKQKAFENSVKLLGFDYHLIYTFEEFRSKWAMHITNSGHTNAF